MERERKRIAALLAVYAVSVLWFALSVAQSGAQAPRKTVAVVDFANRVASWSATGEAVTTRIIAKLRDDPSLRVLPREQVRDALLQAKTETEGFLDPEQAQKIGKDLGADYLMLGEVTTFDQQQKGGCLPVFGCVYTTTATVSLHAKVLGVAEGRFVGEPTSESTKKQGSANITAGSGWGNVSLQNFDGQLIGKATLEAVDMLVKNARPYLK
jgi:curli biogenesis system outer membrane secretion channel CsgG